jgi:hypothetical protein
MATNTNQEKLDYLVSAQFKLDLLHTEFPWYGFDGTVPATGRKTTTLATGAGYADAVAGEIKRRMDADTKAVADALPALVTKAVQDALPALVAQAVADAVAAHPITVDSGAVAEAVFNRFKTQTDKS